MTVIHSKPHVFNHTKSDSDVESLHIPSSGETSETSSVIIDGAPYRPSNNILPFNLPVDINCRRSISFGKRKLRRYYNALSLETVSEEDADDIMATFTVMPFYKGPFTRLLEDERSLEVWNDFVDKPEEEQREILRRNDKCSVVGRTDKSKSSSDLYCKISTKIRRSLRIKKNLSADMISYFETPMIEFFNEKPYDLYTVAPLTSFHRLLVHGIAQYHSLASATVADSDKHNVEITNNVKDWHSVPLLLSDCIKNQRI